MDLRRDLCRVASDWADLSERDRRDSERATSPLVQAADATLLDTTNLSIEAAIQAALDIVGRR